MFEIAGTLLAGIGLFFTGLKLVSENLKQMTSRRFRALVARWTGRSALAGLWGLVLGVVTQSASGVTFIAISLLAGGLITVRRALPILAWANVGLSALVLVAVIDISAIKLYLLGLAGICFAIGEPRRYRYAMGALFGIALLLYGLQIMASGAEPLAEHEWFRTMVRSTASSYVLALTIGLLLTLVAQSSTAVAVVAIQMTAAGLLSAEQTILIIYGCNLGESVITSFLSSSLKGTQKQLAMFQVAFDRLGGLLFVTLFMLETYLHIPLVLALVTRLAARVELQMALVHLIVNATMATLFSLALGRWLALLERRWPATQEEDLGKVQYLQDPALDYPETAIDLAQKEQQRLVLRFPDFMDYARAEPDQAPAVDFETAHAAFSAVAAEVDEFLTSLVNRDTTPATSLRLLNTVNRHTIIKSIENNLSSLVGTVRAADYSPALQILVGNFIEGLDAILLSTNDAFESQEPEDIDLLIEITADRGQLMERLRSTYLSAEASFDLRDKSALFYITTLFERTVWLLNRLGQLLSESLQEARS
ncbi:MAG: Na/Pi cotransporter family protein [Armatimonadetes bacterium]|nr:Na/Pi cotransporter family protein [Armatimonadota bacterium]